jgi:hypothetical protein
MIRKDIILIASVLLGLVIVLFFMTQNTRFESNLISCTNGEKKLQSYLYRIENRYGGKFSKE